jgi:bifunctional NMN adenylyltransferase/nudix hydrolase
LFQVLDPAGPLNVGIIGYNKDHSSYYIKKFPRWEVVEIDPYVVNGQPLNATDLRQEMFIPECVSIPNEYYASLYHRDMLEKYANACQYLIRAEMHHILDYKKSWAAAPYPPVFMTADAVVTQSGHVLLVRRGAQPGEGLWAMPGGFVNQHERVKDAAVRELCEETKIDIPKPVLYGSIVKHELYDDPYRSARGRTITQAYHFKLADQAKLPKVKGSDDAAKAKWFPLNEFVQMRSELFEDHYNIIEDLLGL